MSLAKHQMYMREALALASKAAANGEIPVGAVVVRGEEILGRGANEREARKDPAAHAEMLAIRAAAKAIGDWRLMGCTIYTTLEPCPMCAGALALARPQLIVYGARDERMGCCGSKYDIPGDAVFGSPIPSLGDVLAEECTRLLKEFFAHRRRE